MLTSLVIFLWVATFAVTKTRWPWLTWVQGGCAGLAVAPWALETWTGFVDTYWAQWGLPTSSAPVAHAAALAVLVGIWGVLWDRSKSMRWAAGFLLVVWPKAALAAAAGAAFGWGISSERAIRDARIQVMGLLFGVGGLLTLYPEMTSHRGLPLGLFFSSLVILRHHERELEVLLDPHTR